MRELDGYCDKHRHFTVYFHHFGDHIHDHIGKQESSTNTRMDTRAGFSSRCRSVILHLFRDELPEDQDVFHERIGRHQMVAVHERGSKTTYQESRITKKRRYGSRETLDDTASE